MMMLLIFLLFVGFIYNSISPNEIKFICAYQNVKGFPVNCSDAINACRYNKTFTCVSQVGFSWTESIFSIDLGGFKEQMTIATEIGYLTMLEQLDMIDASLTKATIPTEIGLCRRLKYVSFENTGLSGTIPRELFRNMTQLDSLLFSYNQLTGTVPIEVGAHFPDVRRLHFQNNFLSGTLPDASGMPYIDEYLMQNNQFSGVLPPPFVGGMLFKIDVSNNLLTGTIPDNLIVNPSGFGVVVAKSNHFHGTIPSQLFYSHLYLIDLSHNDLVGTIPTEIALCKKLSQVILSHNHLSGTIPSQLNNQRYQYLFRMSFSHNQLSGTIPTFTFGGRNISIFSNIFIEEFILFHGYFYLNLNNNLLSGLIPAIGTGSFIAPTSIDLSNNYLSLDKFSFGDATNVSWINLANNNMSGRILPDDLFSNTSRFTSLISLDLSYCLLSGTVPSLFRVQYLKLNNNLFVDSLSPYLIDPNYTRLPVFIDLSLNRLDVEASRYTLFGTASSSNASNTEIVLNDFPQDIDECILNSHQCEYFCIDGWFPVPGYTCDCPSGYELDPINKRNCTVVCGDGILKYPDEICDFAFSKYGCTNKCTPAPGYRCDKSGCSPICGDRILVEPEECDGPAFGCTSNCKVQTNYTCSDNTCYECVAQDWTPVAVNETRLLFPRFRALNFPPLVDGDEYEFTSCLLCSGGLSFQKRVVISSVYCTGIDSTDAIPCSFACPNLTIFTSSKESLYTLQQQLEKGDFLNQIVTRQFKNKTIVMSAETTPLSYLSNQLSFTLDPCSSNDSNSVNMSDVAKLLMALTLDIVPNIPLLEVDMRHSLLKCRIDLLSTDKSIANLFSPASIAGISIALLFFIMLVVSLLFTLYYYVQSELHALPKEISWSFFDKLTHPWRWTYNNTDNMKSGGYYSREYDPESEEYSRVESLLSSIFKKGPLKQTKIIAIYNQSLSVSFVNQWKITTTRKIQSSEHFFARTYKNTEAKKNVMRYYDEWILSFSNYNQKLDVPLIGALHGTDFQVAEKIASTGFAALSSLDAGYFGKGIYFTTHLMYTLPYCCLKREPTVILSYINMGNIYPVTESHTGDRSLLGEALKSGYNSHLVLTNKKGHVYDEQGPCCDEIVVGQESQILPAFIIRLDFESCLKELSDWSRDIAKVEDIIPDDKQQQSCHVDISISANEDEYYVLLQ